jgi:dihydrofolate reductase
MGRNVKRSLIVAMSENRVIGRDATLPWHLSSDLRRFKRLTMGHHLVMGRKTFQSLGRALPGRTMIVLTRQPDLCVPGGLVAHDLEHAFQLAGHDEEVFVIGGADVFRLALPVVDRIYLTLVHASIPGDVYFPPVDWDQWTLRESQRFCADAKNEYDFTFSVYDRPRL